MPLDPVFAERVRTHRRYLISTALEQARAFVLRSFGTVEVPAITAPTHRDSTTLGRPAIGDPARDTPPHDGTALGTTLGSPALPTDVSQGPPTRPATKTHPTAPTKRLPKPPRKRKTRAQHRKAARNWDAKELQNVGTPGPDVLTVEHLVPVERYPDVRVRIYYPGKTIPGTTHTSGGAHTHGSAHPSGIERSSAPHDPADEPTSSSNSNSNNSAHTPAPDAPVPGVLAFFGGAFRIGGIDYPTTDAAFRRRAAEAGVAIVAVDYALAPEHRYPTQVEQSHTALEWLFANAPALGIDPTRIAITGISAGGNIAAAVTIMNRERNAHPLALQLLEVPVVDLTGRHVDLRPVSEMGIPRFFAVKEMRSVAKTYLKRRSQAREPHASPLLAKSHARLPRAVILTAEFDPLRGDGAAYTAALRKSGVDASGVQYLGATHDTSIFTGALPAARRWHDDVITALRSLHD